MPSIENDELQALRYLLYVVRENLNGAADKNSVRLAIKSVEQVQRVMQRKAFSGAARPIRPT